MTSFAQLPEDRRSAAVAAIHAHLGAGEISAVEHMQGGSGAGVFRFEMAREGYVLRVEGSNEGPRDNRRAYTCMAIAADGGVAPPVIYADPEAGIAIMRLIRPVQASFAGRLEQTARLLRRLHDLPLFPPEPAPDAAMAWAMGALKGSELLPEAVRREIAAGFGAATTAYPPVTDLVSAHHDLNPSNIVFDGERTWFVDWEQACAADPYIDLASLVNWLGGGEAAKDVILSAYFDAPPTPAQQARFFLMQQINRIAYGAVLLIAGGATQPRLALSQEAWEAAPGLDSIRSEMSILAVHSGRVRFGAAFLKDALSALATPAFTCAIATMAV